MARIFRKLAQLLDVDLASTPPEDGDALTYDAGSETWVPGAGGGGGGAPTDVDYLVGTSDSGLSNEIVVGTSPGGELGGSWASPTVDATHSGSSHAGVQAAAEATAAGALSAHSSDTTGVHGIADTSALVLTGDSRLSDARTPTGTAGGVLSGTYPDPGFAADMATQSELDAHVNDTTAAHAASAISLADAGDDFTATDVEGALAELQADAESDAQALADHLNDASDAHDASAISVADTAGNFTGSDVEAVLAELQDNIDGVSGGSGIPIDGWIAAGETWTYDSADDTTYTFTIAGSDQTDTYWPGMRIRLSQSTGGTKYGIITKVAFSTDTTVTVYMGTDYDLANETISSPYYSLVKAPFGFPLDPSKWTHSYSDSAADRTQTNPAASTWYNLGTATLAIPIGVWLVDYIVCVYSTDASLDDVSMRTTLSNANNTESDIDFTVHSYSNDAGTNWHVTHQSESKILALTSKTSYYLNSRLSAGSYDTLGNLNTVVPARIRAVCAYL